MQFVQLVFMAQFGRAQVVSLSVVPVLEAEQQWHDAARARLTQPRHGRRDDSNVLPVAAKEQTIPDRCPETFNGKFASGILGVF